MEKEEKDSPRAAGGLRKCSHREEGQAQVTLEKGVCCGLGLCVLLAGSREMCGPKGRLGPDCSGCPHPPGKPRSWISAPLL